MTDIPLGEFAPFYKGYIDLVVSDPIAHLNKQLETYVDLIEEHKERLDFKYDSDKWTIRQVIMHIIDTEHVFAYRLLRIARGDNTELAGFDQNIFIDQNDFSDLNADALKEMFVSRRIDTLEMIKTISYENYKREGRASGYNVSAGAILYMIAGHAQHHFAILLERYM